MRDQVQDHLALIRGELVLYPRFDLIQGTSVRQVIEQYNRAMNRRPQNQRKLQASSAGFNYSGSALQEVEYA
jgi:hypothetical protein